MSESDTRTGHAAEVGRQAGIVVDWGTTTFRAHLVDDDGSTLDQRESKSGIQFVKDDQFERALMAEVGDWFARYGALPVYLLGMITSRNGWVEVPYIPCPVDPAALAAGVMRRRLANGSEMTFLPGIQDLAAVPFPDVMRGEETQLIGFGLDRDISVVLPGTHSKWARIRDSRIESFQTFVTGEIYALLADHAFIAQASYDIDADSWSAFDRGVETVAHGGQNTEAMLSVLFSGRTGMLAGVLCDSDIRGYLSGILIALEFHQARHCGWHKSGDTIGLVGNDELTARYKRCAAAFDLSVSGGPKDAALRGALIISEFLAESDLDLT